MKLSLARTHATSAENQNALREHLANERTLLSWVRTAIAVMAFGFVVAKFGLVLRELSGLPIPKETTNQAGAIGAAMILLGVLTLLVGMGNFLRVKRLIEEQIVEFGVFIQLGVASLFVLCGLGIAVWILFTV
ncbi:MAG TPA: DUF202 domain-containing protein [Limnochordia bacterium]|nr:DUF202 domain-containing protein [Limnochordia bacterium]